MKFDEFSKKYKSDGTSITSVTEKWANQKKTDDFLGTPLFGAIVIGDYLDGSVLIDSIPEQVPDEILLIMKEVFSRKVESNLDARAFILEKISKGDSSVQGMMSTLQGRIGEHHFQSQFGELAQLAKNPNQKHWDVKVSLDQQPVNYVQVKVYDNPSQAFGELRKIDEALTKGEIYDDLEQVNKMSFAVNSEIYDEIKTKAEILDNKIEILNIGASREDIRKGLINTVDQHDVLFDGFFENLLGGVITGAALHAGVNGYLLYTGAKSSNQAIEDTIYSGMISAGGIAATLGTELFMAETLLLSALGGPITLGLTIGAGVSTRAVLKRVTSRRFFAHRLIEGNKNLISIINKLNEKSITAAA